MNLSFSKFNRIRNHLFRCRDLIVLVLGNTTHNHDRTVRSVVCRDTNHVRHVSQGVINVLDNVDFVPSNVRFSHQEALLYVFEDNETVIKMVIKGRIPTMRHVSRTHRGDQSLSIRQTVFFLPVDPRNKNHKDPEKIDSSVPRREQYLYNAWKKHQDAVYWVDTTIECYHLSRNTSSFLYSKSC